MVSLRNFAIRGLARAQAPARHPRWQPAPRSGAWGRCGISRTRRLVRAHTQPVIRASNPRRVLLLGSQPRRWPGSLPNFVLRGSCPSQTAARHPRRQPAARSVAWGRCGILCFGDLARAQTAARYPRRQPAARSVAWGRCGILCFEAPARAQTAAQHPHRHIPSLRIAWGMPLSACPQLARVVPGDRVCPRAFHPGGAADGAATASGTGRWAGGWNRGHLRSSNGDSQLIYLTSNRPGAPHQSSVERGRRSATAATCNAGGAPAA